MRLNEKIALPLTAIVGFLYLHLFAVMAFGYMAVNNEFVFNWLVANYPGEFWFRFIINAQDFLINTLIAMPMALFIYFLRPKSYALYAGVALIPGFIWQHSAWINNPYFFQVWQSAATSALFSLTFLPAALLVVIWLGGRRA